MDYRSYDLEQKELLVGWQITITKNEAFVRNSSISKDLATALTEAKAYVDALMSQSDAAAG